MICRKTMKECPTPGMCAPYDGCAAPTSGLQLAEFSPAQEILAFLDDIEGAGYGGMAMFEIARQHAREMVSRQRCSSGTGLLPCPFCGSRNNKLYDRESLAWVACIDCGLEAPSETGVTVDQAITYWNTRDIAQGSSGSVDPLRSLVNELTGFLSVYSHDMRYAAGNTNVAVLQEKLEAARAALSSGVAQAQPMRTSCDACPDPDECVKRGCLIQSGGIAYSAWKPFDSAPRDGTKITAWHKVWDCPVSVRYVVSNAPMKWVEATLTTQWPEEAFTHWQPCPASPMSSTDHEPGCQSGDFGPCDCTLSSTLRATPEDK